MFIKRFKKIKEVFENSEATFQGQAEDFNKAALHANILLKNTRDTKGKVIIIGNGGSAGIASHFSCDLMRTLSIGSQTLFDSNLLTCMGNDFGYEEVFSKPLEVLLQENDLLVAISSSGKSPNILRACNVALEKNVPIMTLSGFSDKTPLRSLGDLNFWVPSFDYGLVEMTHFFILHTIVDTWEETVVKSSFERKNTYAR
jgi:D-sedoheptulose 7-phosphate isomerase